MTGDVVNFKQAQKRASYAKKELTAAENREKFGRTKVDKRKHSFAIAKEKQHMDDHKLDD